MISVYNKKQKTFHKILIIICLLSLSISAFYIRSDNFRKYYKRGGISHDENRYCLLGLRLKGNILNYTLQDFEAIYNFDQERIDREYFRDPQTFQLYFHPPLFSMLLAAVFKIFGERALAAIAVPIIFNILTIWVTCALASRLISPKAGLVSAFLLFLDPINVVSSQKLWMDTTLSFFTLFSIYLFVRALKNESVFFFFTSGFVCGLAALTKYPGILVVGGFFLYALLMETHLFRKPRFYLSLLMPFLVMLPWVYWNYHYYGFDIISRIDGMFITFERTRGVILISGILSVFFAITWIRFLKYSQREALKGFVKNQCGRLRVSVLIVFGCLVILQGWPFLLSSLFLFHLPEVSWKMGFFDNAPRLFYLYRLMEYSILYLFAFLSFFIKGQTEDRRMALLKISAFFILIFYTFWGFFQCRYILAATPMLIILSVHILAVLKRNMANGSNIRIKAGNLMLDVLVIFAVLRMMRIDVLLAFPNDMCYF
ncbi:MAG: glycosyltransferase family 39 protein [Candidatus Omnitrophica bacterium]|nr:glycosyltransferase family 39 protein [Candidatus Omnitrophota bacterium]